jgi:hypothetical protein
MGMGCVLAFILCFVTEIGRYSNYFFNEYMRAGLTQSTVSTLPVRTNRTTFSCPHTCRLVVHYTVLHVQCSIKPICSSLLPVVAAMTEEMADAVPNGVVIQSLLLHT